MEEEEYELDNILLIYCKEIAKDVGLKKLRKSKFEIKFQILQRYCKNIAKVSDKKTICGFIAHFPVTN